MEDFAKPIRELGSTRLIKPGVAIEPAAQQGLSLDHRGKIPMNAGLRMITGRVAAAGTVAAGSGFTVSFNGVSTYTITFTFPFVTIPIVLWQDVDNATLDALSSVTVSGFVAVTQGAASGNFNFLAIEVA